MLHPSRLALTLCLGLLDLCLRGNLHVFLVDVGVVRGQASQLAQVLEANLILSLGDQSTGGLDDNYMACQLSYTCRCL